MEIAATVLAVGIALYLTVRAAVLYAEATNRRRAAALPDAPDAELEELLGTEVLINTRRPDDQSVRGVLTEAGPRWLRLERAAYVPSTPGGQEEPLAAGALVPREGIAYVQPLGPATGVIG